MNPETQPKEGCLCSRCKNNEARELHSCPYQREINDNEDDEYCDCCESCTDDCLMDI